MKFLATCINGALSPADQIGADYMRKLKPGVVTMVEVKRARNPKMHRLYWALVSMVFENQERYESQEQVHAALKLATGIYTMIELPSGTQYKIPGSIKFEKMSQDEFNGFFDKVCDVVAKHFIPGITNVELQKELGEIVGLGRPVR